MLDLELDELKREFLDEARDKVAEMQTALEAGLGSAALDRIAYLVHQLKGSGGSYGYQLISTEAEEVEKALKSLTALQSGDATVEAKIQQHVVNLRTEIERRARELA